MQNGIAEAVGDLRSQFRGCGFYGRTAGSRWYAACWAHELLRSWIRTAFVVSPVARGGDPAGCRAAARGSCGCQRPCRLCAFLSPEPIPRTRLPGRRRAVLVARRERVRSRGVGQVLARIGRQALVRIDHDGLRIHRLTAAIIGQSLSPPEQAAALAAAERSS